MQDQRGGRYVIEAFDSHSWSILDIQTQQVYALILAELGNFTIQLQLVEVMTSSGTNSYLAFLTEVMSCRLIVSDPLVAVDVAQDILKKLEEGHDVANPVEIASLLGADLHGQRVGQPTNRAH